MTTPPSTPAPASPEPQPDSGDAALSATMTTNPAASKDVKTSADAFPTTKQGSITPRALLLGLAASLLLALWTPYNNYKVFSTLIGGNQFPTIAFALLIGLVFVNIPLRRYVPKRAFTSAELITVWTCALVASGIPFSGMMRTFIPNIPAPTHFSNARNNWEDRVWGDMPSWLLIQNPESAKAFYSGYPRGAESVPWADWIVPLIGWGSFMAFFLLGSFVVASILREQWIEKERFAFPLVALPLLLAETDNAGVVPNVLKRPALWVAVALTTTLHTINGLHRLYPAVPELVTNINLMEFLTVAPWNALGPLSLMFYPLVMGLGYLLPAEVGLSLWLFHILFKGESLVAALNNWEQPVAIGGFSQRLFHAEQAVGGAFVLTAYCLWAARAHLKHIFTHPTRGAQRFGLAVAFGGMALWEIAAGIPIPLIVLSLCMTIVAMVTVGWATCQAGVLFMAMPYTSFDVLAPTLGTAPFQTSALYTLYRAEFAAIYNTREMLLPALLNAYKGASVFQIPTLRFSRALGVSVALAVVAAGAACIALPYLSGGGQMMAETWSYNTGPQIPLNFLGNAAATPYKASPFAWAHIGGGAALVGSLLALRARYGIGLHPIGFIAASVWGIQVTWFSLFLGWAAKSAILRLGGMNGFRICLPFFLGLIVGDALNAFVWTILGALTGVAYNVTSN